MSHRADSHTIVLDKGYYGSEEHDTVFSRVVREHRSTGGEHEVGWERQPEAGPRTCRRERKKGKGTEERQKKQSVWLAWRGRGRASELISAMECSQRARRGAGFLASVSSHDWAGPLFL